MDPITGLGLVVDAIDLLANFLSLYDREGAAAAAARDQAAALRAAQHDRVVEGFISLLEESEDRAVEMLSRLQEVSEGEIDNTTLMEMANLAMSSKVTEAPDVMADLLEVAETRAAILGRDVNDVWGDMIIGIATLNEDLLAQQGLIVDTDAAYEDYATQVLHKSVDSMSTLEKQQALMRALSADEVTQELTERPAFDPSALERTLAGLLNEMTTKGQQLLYGQEPGGWKRELLEQQYRQYTTWMDWLEVNEPETWWHFKNKFTSAGGEIWQETGQVPAPREVVDKLMKDPEVIEKFTELELLYGRSLAEKAASMNGTILWRSDTSDVDVPNAIIPGPYRKEFAETEPGPWWQMPPLWERLWWLSVGPDVSGGEAAEQLYILPESGAPSPQGAVRSKLTGWPMAPPWLLTPS